MCCNVSAWEGSLSLGREAIKGLGLKDVQPLSNSIETSTCHKACRGTYNVILIGSGSIHLYNK